MLPFYFGSSDRPLFGVYHPPENGPVGTDGVVLCPPLGREYVHAHRALRRLAESLAAEGTHVLRFDYGGCGDSAGDASEGRIGRWTEDLGTAVEELRATGGAREIGLVGLRLGAALAALGCRERDDVRSLVLWEPVTDGASYLDHLVSGHRRMIRDRHPPLRDGSGAGGEREAFGFPIPDGLREELQGLDLLELGDPGVEAGGLVASRPDERCRELHHRLREAGADFELRNVPTEGTWERMDEAGQALLPREALDTVVELARRDR